MSNQITIIFQACEPAPSGGYIVQYRPVGSTDPYTTYPTPFFASPIVFNDGGANPDDTDYEGYLVSDCGNGNLGIPVHWSTLDCDPVTLPADISFPTAMIGIPYSHSITLGGSAPFVLDTFDKPSWMIISVTGNTLSFTGTPTSEGEDIEVSFNISNCYGGSTVAFDSTIDVIFVNWFVENFTADPRRFQVDNVQGFGISPLVVTPIVGNYPVNSGQQMIGVHGGFPGPFLRITLSTPNPGTLVPNKKLVVRKNGVIVYSTNLLFSGAHNTLQSFDPEDEIRIQIVHV